MVSVHFSSAANTIIGTIGDRLVVVDPDSDFFGKTGKITKMIVISPNSMCTVTLQFRNGITNEFRFEQIGKRTKK